MGQLIPLSVPNFCGNEKKYVEEALRQGWVSTGGAYIKELERKLEDFLQVGNVAACQSGTSALHLSMIECGVSSGDLVIVPTLTFIAAVNPVRYLHADPVFMDCDGSLCIDPIKLERFCQEECCFEDGILRHKGTGKRVRAIVVVHVFGNLADMDAIMGIAETYHLKVVEDATEALGSYYTKGRFRGRFAGTVGDFGAYSFNGNKIITTGGGGAVTAKVESQVDHMRYLSTQSKDDSLYYVHNEVGYNYRMTNLQAALGVAQMEELPGFIKQKQRNYGLYKILFEGFEYGRLLPFREGTYSNKWFYSLEVDRDKVTCSMKGIIAALEGKGIQTRAIWGLIHEQVPYRDALAYQIGEAPYCSSRILNLPCSTQLTEEEIHYVATQVKAVLEGVADER